MEAIQEAISFSNDSPKLNLECEHCGRPFTPRLGSGGRRQRFCSSECRTAFNNAERSSQQINHEPTYHQQINENPQRIGPTAETLGTESPEPSTTALNLPALTESATTESESAATDEGWCWAVPRQARIECSATTDHEIEIEEYSDLDESENVRICVARTNAVRLARCILYATGFKSILIATGVEGGWSDVEDGNLPEHFDVPGRP
jgi:hypothetical protein